MSGDNQDRERFDEALRGATNLTGAINTAEYITQFSLQPDNEWPARGYNDSNIWYEVNGADVSSLKPKATLAELTTDGAQTDSKVAVESPSLVYRPGTELSVSAGLFVDVLPEGDSKYEVIYGREPRSIADPFTGESVDVGKEYAGLRIVDAPDASERTHDLQFVVGTDPDGDGTVTENVVPITAGDWEAEEYITTFEDVPQAEVYGKDPLNGGGPSNIQFDARRGYTMGVEIGWYAPTSMVPYLVETVSQAGRYKQRRHPILIYNPIEGPAIQRPNQPVRVVADNGTSGQDLSARLGGRAGAYNGDVGISKSPIGHNAYNQDVPGAVSTTGTQGLEWSIVAVAKVRAVDPDGVVSPRPASLLVDNNASLQVRICRESDISGTIEYDEPSNTNRADTPLAIDAVADTPDRLSINTVTDPADGEDKLAGDKVGGGLLSSGGNNKTGLTDREEDFGISIPRDLVFVWLVADLGSNLSADGSYYFIASG